MSAFTTIQVPIARTNTIGAILNLEGSPGPLNFSIQDIIAKGPKYTGDLVASGATIRILESADGEVWTRVGSEITLNPGGEKMVNIISQKPWVAISGRSAAGGYVRVDIAHRGEPFRGQVTIGKNIGKRGLGKDFTGETATALLTAEPAVPTYPE